jgi:hypothetical protein
MNVRERRAFSQALLPMAKSFRNALFYVYYIWLIPIGMNIIEGVVFLPSLNSYGKTSHHALSQLLLEMVSGEKNPIRD